MWFLLINLKEFALFKSVEQNNQFKKQHFLNPLNKITNLKSASKGGDKKIYFASGKS
jgi:hypothetical protein